VSMPIKIEVSGGTGLTWKYGRQLTGGSLTTTFDTSTAPFASVTSTEGTWSDYGDQGASGEARLDGKVSIAIKPYLKFTFGDLAGAASTVDGAFAVLPDWIVNNPWAQGFVSLATELSIPELSGTLATDEKCVGGTNTATTRIKLTTAGKAAGKITIAEEALNKMGWAAPSFQAGVDLLTASLPTLDVWTGPASTPGDCGGPPPVDCNNPTITNPDGTTGLAPGTEDCVYPPGYWTHKWPHERNPVTCEYAVWIKVSHRLGSDARGNPEITRVDPPVRVVAGIIRAPNHTELQFTPETEPVPAMYTDGFAYGWYPPYMGEGDTSEYRYAPLDDHPGTGNSLTCDFRP